jgi:hypothetical protein
MVVVIGGLKWRTCELEAKKTGKTGFFYASGVWDLALAALAKGADSACGLQFLMVLPKYRVTISKVKAQDLAFIGST